MPDGQISVIIPVYNRAAYVAEAIESVLGQTTRAAELIVIDDGSSDGSAAVIRRFGSALHYRYRPNGGIAAARNAGVALATGTYLAFLDSDDLWMPTKLARQMAVLAAHPETDAVAGHLEQFVSPELDEAVRSRIRLPEGKQPGYNTPMMLIRREAFDQVGPFDETVRVGVDLEWYARFVEMERSLIMLPDVVYRRRVHRSNLNSAHANPESARLHTLKKILDRRRGRTEPVRRSPM